MSPLARRRRFLELRSLAASCARLDARGELGTLGVALLSAARDQARAHGVLDVDINEATLEGLDMGRA